MIECQKSQSQRQRLHTNNAERLVVLAEREHMGEPSRSTARLASRAGVRRSCFLLSCTGEWGLCGLRTLVPNTRTHTMNEMQIQSLQILETRVPGVVSTHGEQDDTHLVQASQRGNQDAFALLVQRHQRRVFNMSVRMLQDPEEANEATQEAFLAAWRGLPTFRGEAQFSSWLYRISYNCCFRVLEARKQEQTLQVTLQAEQTLPQHSNEQQAMENIEQQERRVLVREQLEQLPAKYRIVLILRHLQDRTYEEMADILTMPIGTIKTHLFRARNLLKERVLAQYLRGPV